MDRVAVFVDAGYLFAAGATALTGSNKPRNQLDLDEKNAVSRLLAFVGQIAPSQNLLRVYWYDGAGFKGPTLEQKKLAAMDDVKLRLGFLNTQGQQKGVDSLIVTDLIELARNNAIATAVLVSGDEDVRVGVQVAQSYGVRVHLLGIEPAGASQSKQLIFEADTSSELPKADVAGFLRHNTPEKQRPALKPTSPAVGAEAPIKVLEQVAGEVVAQLSKDDVHSLVVALKGDPSIPPELDGKLLGKARDLLGRNLDREQCRDIRQKFRDLISVNSTTNTG